MNKPVAYAMFRDGEFYDAIHPKEYERIAGEYDTPLYTHPVKELTDEEIWKTIIKEMGEFYSENADAFELCKAILRKAQEK